MTEDSDGPVEVPTPRVVSTLLVRDEVDIVEAHLRYHLAAGVSDIVVTDNGSTDGTRAVLERYSRLGSVHVIDEPSTDFSQPEWVSRMAVLAYEELGADWVIHCDTDEFWYPRGRDLPAFFSRLPAGTECLTVGIYDFVPVRAVADRHPTRMIFRRRLPRKVKIGHRGRSDVRIAFGNHRVISPELATSAAGRGLQMLHYPARSLAQFEKKVLNGGASLLRNPKLSPETCSHWRKLYAKYRQGGLARHYHDEVEFSLGRTLVELLKGRLVLDGRLSRRLRESAPLERSEEARTVVS